jgi:hypothetical protein
MYLTFAEPDSVKLTAEGDLTYFYKQEEVKNLDLFFCGFIFVSFEHDHLVLDIF